MKLRTALVALFLTAILAVFLLRQKTALQVQEQSPEAAPASAVVGAQKERGYITNRLGDALISPNDEEFANRIFPKFREFVGTLERLGVSPFEGEIQAASCSKIRVVHIPNGILCPFVIGDRWTADYLRTDTFEGIAHFKQRGPDDPFRAISSGNTDALKRVSELAIVMPQEEAWKIANRVADAFGIDRSRYEQPQMTDEAMFEYRLGLQTVRFRMKGSDPLNRLNYTRLFTLKATSTTTAVLVKYSNFEAR